MAGFVWRFGLAPGLLYFIGFGALTYPLLTQFRTHLFADQGDGFQNVWNIWWVNKSVTELGQLPWYTSYLQYPTGTSLLGHTLNPFNGLLGILLHPFLSLSEVFNAIVVFSFVMGGITAFWLAYSLTRAYWSSWVAGALFTFSQFHFMHAEGHLQLVALEWIPLFLLCWHHWLRNPSVAMALMASGSLFAVLLCDHYYFLYCVMAALVMASWRAASTRQWLFWLEPAYRRPLAAFALATLVTSGVLVGALLRQDWQDPFFGAHDPNSNSLDVLAPLIPGGHWRFAALTRPYWEPLGDMNEHSVYLGWSVIGLVLYAGIKGSNTRPQAPSWRMWYALLGMFYLLALGPSWHLAGQVILDWPTPYDLFLVVFPPLKLSGVPVRMMVMVTLCTALISAAGLQTLFQRLRRRETCWLVGLALALVLGLEMLPRPLPTTPLDMPAYVEWLRALPPGGGVVDTVAPTSIALYYQTRHEKPLIEGYISRYPASVFDSWQQKAIAARHRDYLSLAEKHGARYLVTRADSPHAPCAGTAELIAADQHARLFALRPTQQPRTDYVALPADTTFPSELFDGFIDHYDQHQLTGWALLRDFNAASSQVFVLLMGQAHLWRLPTCRLQRPDVTAYYRRDTAYYDDAGYFVHLPSFAVPAGVYRLGILVENAGQRAAIWTDHTYAAPRRLIPSEREPS